jgi:pilus assembly protein CpaC
MSPQIKDTLSLRLVLLVGLFGASAVAGWWYLRPRSPGTSPIPTESRTPEVSEQPGTAAIGSFDELSEAPPAPTSEVVETRPAVVLQQSCPNERQVCMRVVMAEVNLAAARKIGLDFATAEEQGIQQLLTTTGANPSEGFVVVLDNGAVESKLKELKAKNLARSLAEPNLIALNGMPANFLVGGQFPVPVKSETPGTEEVTYVPYGVQLSFTPHITKEDRIRLILNLTISRRKLASDAKTTPELTSRVFATTVELKPVQTMIVTGINQGAFVADSLKTQSGETAAVNSQPLGAEESDFVLLVTPELVCRILSNETK